MRENFSSSEKNAPRRLEGELGHKQVCNNRSRKKKKKKKQEQEFKEFSTLSMGEAPPPPPQLTEFLPFISTSAVWSQASFLVHLASCIPPALQQSPLGDGSTLWIAVFRTLNHFWRPEISDG